MQIFVARNSGMEDADEVYRFWCACQIVHTELAKNSQYTGWYADMELQNFGKDLLDGFILQDKAGNNLLTYSLWSHKEFPDFMLLYQAMNDEHILTLYQVSAKEDIMRQIESMKQEYVQAGTVAKPLIFENGVLKS